MLIDHLNKEIELHNCLTSTPSIATPLLKFSMSFFFSFLNLRYFLTFIKIDKKKTLCSNKHKIIITITIHLNSVRTRPSSCATGQRGGWGARVTTSTPPRQRCRRRPPGIPMAAARHCRPPPSSP